MTVMMMEAGVVAVVVIAGAWMVMAAVFLPGKDVR